LSTPAYIGRGRRTKLPGFTRRTALHGVAGGLALPVLGPGNSQASDFYDVAIIGAGTAGLPAAIFAAERGARVLIVDKAPIIGGTLDRSGGQMAAAGTVFQRRKGIVDSPDVHFNDNMRINRGTADPELTRLFVDNAGDTVNWLARHGFKVAAEHPIAGANHEPFSVPRYLWGPENGKSILQVMEPLFLRGVKSGRITMLLNSAAVDLIQEPSGAVRGVVVEHENGELRDHSAKNVLITSGGCAANPRMFEDLHGTPLTTAVAYPFSQGMGLTLGQGAGGYVRGGDKFLGLFGMVLSDDNFPADQDVNFNSRPEIRPPWELYVNVHGQRFMREDDPSVHYREHALTQQPGARLWALFDQKVLEAAPLALPRWTRERMLQSFNAHPMFSRAETLDVLAVRAGINPAGVRATVNEFNAARESGSPDPFGRIHRPLPISTPPFYAIRLTSYSILSFAGLAVDRQLRVIDRNGTPIPNLFAAGEVLGAGATSGNAYTGGAMVTPALTFGRLLGQKLLKFD
jgi:fumarate reductase flavoprotein subunit